MSDWTDIDDVLEFISDAYESDLKKIKYAVLSVKTLEDQLKIDLITEALKKYSLTQLEEKLK